MLDKKGQSVVVVLPLGLRLSWKKSPPQKPAGKHLLLLCSFVSDQAQNTHPLSSVGVPLSDLIFVSGFSLGEASSSS